MIPEKAHFYINQLQLLKHPEGGWYKETYRSNGSIAEVGLTGYTGNRSFSTAIYFLLTSDNFSGFHRIVSDELWHFYAGDGLTIHEINENGNYIKHELGLDIEGVEEPQLMVHGKSWFASEIKSGGSWCLVGCTVAPGFDFADFELADRATLVSSFPEYRSLIERLTRQST